MVDFWLNSTLTHRGTVCSDDEVDSFIVSLLRTLIRSFAIAVRKSFYKSDLRSESQKFGHVDVILNDIYYNLACSTIRLKHDPQTAFLYTEKEGC